MQRKRHSPEQIVRKLREADAELAAGVPRSDVCKKLGISENTLDRWRNQYGGIKADDMKRLKELEKENHRLKHAVAELLAPQRRTPPHVPSAGPAGGNPPVCSRFPRPYPHNPWTRKWGPVEPSGEPGCVSARVSKCREYKSRLAWLLLC
jgi:putative transposase